MIRANRDCTLRVSASTSSSGSVSAGRCSASSVSMFAFVGLLATREIAVHFDGVDPLKPDAREKLDDCLAPLAAPVRMSQLLHNVHSTPIEMGMA